MSPSIKKRAIEQLATRRPPYLLLDVDGVLALRGGVAAGFEPHTVEDSAGTRHRVWLNVDHGRWLRSLADDYEVVWATGWGHDAPRLLGPLLGLPPMSVLEFTERPRLGVTLNKLDDVAAFVRQRPTAWIDDDIDDQTRLWAAQRGAPTLLVDADPTIGMTYEHVALLEEFSDSLASS